MAKPDSTPDRDAIVDALMALAADRPWDDIEIGDIAEAANVSLSEFRQMFPSKGAILGQFLRRIDLQVLGGSAEELAGEPVRERLFDVYMRRLDAMAPYRVALRRIAYAVRFDPLTLAALNQAELNSQRFMLAAAGIPTEDSLGIVKMQGGALVFSRTLETWFDDADPHMAATMARLDRELRRGERIMGGFEGLERVSAPFRAIGQAILDGGKRFRSRDRRRRDDEAGETTDPAAAI